MKKYFVLTSVLALAACFGGSGGGGVSVGTSSHTGRPSRSTPNAVIIANRDVTDMETFSSNAEEIVARVEGVGIKLDDGSSSVNSARPSVARSGAVSADTLKSAFNERATSKQKLAMDELKNMYDIATDTEYFNSATETQLRNAFLLAGNNNNDFNASNRDAARTAIQSGYAAVLDALVAKDGSDYLWSPKTDVLENVKFRLGGEDSYIKFILDENGYIASAAKYDRDGDGYSISEEGIFNRPNHEKGNSFGSGKILYEWSYVVPDNILANAEFEANDAATHILQDLQQKPITLDNDNSNLAQSDIRTGILNKINDRLDNLNLSEDDVNAAKTAIAAVVNAHTFEAPEELTAKLNVSGEKLGLRYADLGFAELVVSNADGTTVLERSFTPYVGGYESRKIEDLAKTVEFTGTAIAGVDHKETHNMQQTVNDGMLIRGKGVLTMDTAGTGKLVMTDFVGVDAEHKGHKWYNLTVETNANANGGAPKFTVGEVNGVRADFTMNTEFDKDGKIEVVFTQDDLDGAEYVKSSGNTRYGGMVEFNAYGPTVDNPTEATSRFSFSEEQHWNDNKDHREVAVYGAFGGKKSSK